MLIVRCVSPLRRFGPKKSKKSPGPHGNRGKKVAHPCSAASDALLAPWLAGTVLSFLKRASAMYRSYAPPWSLLAFRIPVPSAGRSPPPQVVN